MLFNAHTRAFSAFGGIPRRGIYDTMKIAVDRARAGTATGQSMYVFRRCAVIICSNRRSATAAASWEKGIVEKSIQDRRRHLWTKAAQHRWEDLEGLNAWLTQACTAA